MKLFTIPNLITLGNLLCGVFGILAVSNGQLKEASYLIFLALILDFLDGFVARLSNSFSEIGKQLDSLADMVSFGVLPTFILFSLLQDAGNLKYLALLPVLASALRLAKFNIDERQTDSFRGLPTPANAMVVASFPFIIEKNWNFLSTEVTIGILAIYAAIISVLMISDIPMLALKFKNYSWESNAIRYLFLIVSLILLLVLHFASIPLILILFIALSILFEPRKPLNNNQ